MRVQCRCGRFLARAYPVAKARFLDWYLAEVRGDCSRCGKDVEAGDGWWWSWDAWSWDVAAMDRALTDGFDKAMAG